MDQGRVVGVVMATRDRAGDVLTTLRRLDALPERPPVVVVDNASSDDTSARVAEAFPEVRVERLPANLGAAARAVGAAVLDTPLVAFNDDDSWWAPGALTRAAERFAADPGLGLLAATVLVGQEERPDPVNEAMASSALAAGATGTGVPVLGFLACGAVVRRDAFLEAGGFEPRYGVGGEEELLALDLARAGWQVEHHPDVVVHHHPSGSSRDPEARRRRQVRNAFLTALLRHRWPDVARRAGSLAATTPPRTFVGGLRELAPDLGWALSCRRPLPRHLQEAVRLVS